MDGFEQEQSMKKYLMPLVAAVALGIATPAMAYDTGSLISMHEAMDIAADLGLVTVSNTQFAGDKWEIYGRDNTGRYMEVAVDLNTGNVLWVNR
jgi:Peptidase propeptide and YPEB domain